MKYYRFNQIAMAVLGALLLIFGTRTIIKIAFEEHEAEKPGYEVPGAKKEAAGQPGAPAAQGEDILTLIAQADAAKGAEVAKKCEICHNFEKGGPNMIGPNLYGVLGRKVASHEGYEYSEALKAKGGVWDYESVSKMDENPAAYVPGTKMALFPGLPDIKQRAELLAFMRTKNDNPPPLPEAKAAPAAAPAAAGGEAKPAGENILALLAHADAKRGAEVAKKCEICHNFEKGGPNMIGPNLYGVLGRKVASHEGYDYSDALKAKGGVWDYEFVAQMDANPAAYVPGTKMALFQGLPDIKQRADLLAFIRTKNDNPPPLPAASEGGAPAPAEAPKAEAPAAAPAEAPKAEAPAAAPAPAPAETPAPAPAPEAPQAETPAPTPAPEAPKAEAPAPEATPSAPATEGQPASTAPAGTVVPLPGKGELAPSYKQDEQSNEKPAASEPQAVVPAEGGAGSETGGGAAESPSVVLPGKGELTPSYKPDEQSGEKPSPSEPQPVVPGAAPPQDY